MRKSSLFKLKGLLSFALVVTIFYGCSSVSKTNKRLATNSGEEVKTVLHENYPATSNGDIADDIKLEVISGAASSAQSSSGIEKSFDGNMNTLYHSNWNNRGDNYFPITLDYNFKNEESLDYLVYHPRQSGNNGRFKEGEVWVSTEANHEFTKIMDFDFEGSGTPSKIVFDEPIDKPKSVRFIVNSGAGDGQGYATCAEMEFYRANPNNFDPLTLFTDMTCSELKPGVTLAEINKVSNNLYRNIAQFMFNGRYPREFRIEEYRAWPHPSDWARENKTSTLSLLDNPTGMSVEKGEELIVFVGDTHGYDLALKIQDLDTPNSSGYGNASFHPLSAGVNKIKPLKRGLAYIFYHTPEYEIAPPVKIHFATGKVNGYFDSQKHEPQDWSKYLNAAVDKYFDVVGDHAHLTFPTESFKAHALENGDKLIETYDEMVRLQKDFMGLMKYNRPTVNRAYFHVVYNSYMYSTSYRTAYNVGTVATVLNVEKLRSSPWGPAHEMGHSFQTRPGFKWQGTTEATNNVHSLYVQTEFGNASRIQSEKMGRYNNRYEKAYHSSFINNTPHFDEGDVFCKLVPMWQLQLYFSNAMGQTDFYKDFYEMVRTSPNKATTSEQLLDFVKMTSDVSQTNLVRFFKRWGYLTPYDDNVGDYGGPKRTVVTQNKIDETISYIESKNYPEVTNVIEYISDSNWKYFKNRSSVKKGTATKKGAEIKMTNWENVVAYEVYENDELVFVSNLPSFKLDEPMTNSAKVYAIAYDGSKTEVTF